MYFVRVFLMRILNSSALQRSKPTPSAAPAWRDAIIQGDCVAALEALPSNSVDLVFADPPYNLQLGGDLHRPDQSGSMPSTTTGTSSTRFAAYDAFTRAWLLAAAAC